MKQEGFDITEIILIIAIVLVAAFTIIFVLIYTNQEKTLENDAGISTKEQSFEENNVEQQTEKENADQLNKKMVGIWISEKGVGYDIYSFGYMSDSGISSNPNGQLCITVDYGKYEGGGNAAAEYYIQDGQLIYTTVDSSYNAGGSVDDYLAIDTENLSENKAVINGVSYIKVSDNPSDDGNALQIIESRLRPILSDEWEDSDGLIYLKLNKNGTMRYEDTSMSVDGTWKCENGMLVTLKYVDVYTNEVTYDYFQYKIDNDYLLGIGLNQMELYRK